MRLTAHVLNQHIPEIRFGGERSSKKISAASTAHQTRTPEHLGDIAELAALVVSDLPSLERRRQRISNHLRVERLHHDDQVPKRSRNPEELPYPATWMQTFKVLGFSELLFPRARRIMTVVFKDSKRQGSNGGK